MQHPTHVIEELEQCEASQSRFGIYQENKPKAFTFEKHLGIKM